MLIKFTNELWVDSDSLESVCLDSQENLVFKLKSGKSVTVFKLLNLEYEQIINALNQAQEFK